MSEFSIGYKKILFGVLFLVASFLMTSGVGAQATTTADLELLNVVVPATVNETDDVNITFSVKNNGPDAVTGIDFLGSGYSMVDSAVIACGSSVMDSNQDMTIAIANGAQVDCTLTGKIVTVSSESETRTFGIAVDPLVAVDLTSNDYFSQDMTILAPYLEFTHSFTHTGTPSVGDPAVLEVTITNTGEADYIASNYSTEFELYYISTQLATSNIFTFNSSFADSCGGEGDASTTRTNCVLDGELAKGGSQTIKLEFVVNTCQDSADIGKVLQGDFTVGFSNDFSADDSANRYFKSYESGGKNAEYDYLYDECYLTQTNNDGEDVVADEVDDDTNQPSLPDTSYGASGALQNGLIFTFVVTMLISYRVLKENK